MKGEKNIPIRDPMMLRGYYIRTFIMRDIVRRFMEHDDKSGTNQRQIINLGAGYDTLYWWIKDNKLINHEKESANVKYYEIDFLPVLQRKLTSLSQSKDLLSKITGEEEIFIDIKQGILQSPEYYILPCDLRDIDSLQQTLSENHFDPSLVEYEKQTNFLIFSSFFRTINQSSNSFFE